MFKTLLAGTLLSTGLIAGGAVGTEDVKSNQKVEKSKYSETIERPEGTESQPGHEFSKAIKKPGSTDSNPVFEMGNPEKSGYAKTVERSEGTDSQEGKNVPTKEGN
ncbi:hypothetical protein FT637_27345 [Bacillus cereus]|uniref:hypothetical protein n=1 Tax=Bacillus cereus TaxID=1396 RepID=UPI00187A7323|nr:hypothetical protein [Bacillus cereus]MBE7106593.1 hypothetical protein [Bacillus cereus]MBE7123438.1 hypothetical protein [Bacillus cereus]